MGLNGARATLRLFPGIEDVAASVVLEVDEAVPAVAEVDVDRGLVAAAFCVSGRNHGRIRPGSRDVQNSCP